MPKLTDTQSIILSRAATRPDNLAMPLPDGLVGAAAKMAVAKMIERGWLEEVEANLRRGEPLWRETGDGHGTTLIATEAGLAAIGIEPVVATTMTNLRKAKLEVVSAPKDAAQAHFHPNWDQAGDNHRALAATRRCIHHRDRRGDWLGAT